MGIAKVFIIIVTYNGKQWYDRCLHSLRQSVIPIEIVVVDNASTDDTVEYIKTHFPEVILLESQINLGFGQGNNKGIRYALDHAADYVFLLNQDAWIEPDTICELVRIHNENLEFGILSPMHLNADKTGIEKGLMHYVADYRITTPDLINDLYFERRKDIYETQYVNAAAWLLPRKTLETVGGFDPIFFHYGEDDNYMQRVHFHSYKIGICPHVRVCHDTERREIKKVFLDKTSKKCLLVQYTDINIQLNIQQFALYSFRKALLKAVKLNFKASNKLISEALYILKQKDSIQQSKMQNRKIASSWL